MLVKVFLVLLGMPDGDHSGVERRTKKGNMRFGTRGRNSAPDFEWGSVLDRVELQRLGAT